MATKATQQEPAKVRHIRIPDEVFLPAVDRAEKEGLGAAELVRALLRAYARGEVEV